MNWSEIQQNWAQSKVLLRTHWPELTDDDVERVSGDRAELVATLCRLPGFTADSAEREVCKFEKDVRFPGAVK